jgi:pSer/pThr/pTyr-binding forkhead associated (FHA) protein
LLFDPIDLILLGPDKPSAAVSRLIGFAVIGACVGAMIGVVELLARDAWLRMTQGPLAGKEFLIFKDVMNVGSSPRSDIYLFNDPTVSESHARLRAVGADCEIENLNERQPALLNGRPVRHARLRHGDQISIGRTIFVFQTRKR